MGGFFSVASKEDCVSDLFYGIDYHSHLGNMRGGMMVRNIDGGFFRSIHDIRREQFRAKFERELDKMKGNMGIGCISDCDEQPLVISCAAGTFGITTVGLINNLEALKQEFFREYHAHFCQMTALNSVTPTEIVASLIAAEDDILSGIVRMQDKIDGSMSVMLLTEEGIYLARSKEGHTPIVIGEKEGAYAAAFESCALVNTGYKVKRWLGPGEVVLMTADGVKTLVAPRKKCRMCAFMWVYYGFPASSYDGINVEDARYRCGAALARQDVNDKKVDMVCGVPDSGVAHALGYAQTAGIPYKRPFVKYTPTWPRSFISDNQKARRHVAKMKLIPINDFINGNSLLFCEDSIVRGTQLKDTFARLPEWGAKEVHVRSACPPILFGCKYLNFSPSYSPLELIARRAINRLEGGKETEEIVRQYADCHSEKYKAMVEEISKEMGFSSLKFQNLDDMIAAIGLPEDSLCTYCWNGRE